MKVLNSFASCFGAKIGLNPEFIKKKMHHYFLLNPALYSIVKEDFYCAGLYLGKENNGKFFPSFIFLNLLAKLAVNKVFISKKAAWLFICGRDVFQEAILEAFGSKQKGAFVLVLNEFSECLGFGELTQNFGSQEGGIAIRNILDVGDFLRRER